MIFALKINFNFLAMRIKMSLHSLPRLLLLVLCFVFACAGTTLAQTNNVGIGTSTPHPNALLDLSSADKGLLVPRLNTLQRLLLIPLSSADGLMVYDIDLKQFCHWNAAISDWTCIEAAGGGGLTGPTGPAGPAGLNGSVGPTGAVGANGLDGAVGPSGPAGLMGANGVNGLTGSSGADGIDGVTGPTGADGPAGPGGLGSVGPTGADGVNGAVGATGPAGAVGANGPMGPSGTDGIDGVTGPTGADGPTGPNGSSSALPSGVILMWSGTLANIPAGFALCDGTNGTPNLLDRFVLSVPTSGTDPGAIGGAHSYSLSVAQLPAHSHNASGTTAADGDHGHTGSTSTDGGHTHTLPGFHLTIDPAGPIAWYNWANPTKAFNTNTTSLDGAHAHTLNVNNAGTHSHGFNVTTSSTGTGSAVDNRPAYYALAFIMKL